MYAILFILSGVIFLFSLFIPNGYSEMYAVVKWII